MKKIILFIASSLGCAFSYAQLNYPATKTVDSSHTYFGKTYKDPYNWLENLKDKEVENWFKQQANLTNQTMDKISGRDELIAEYKMLDKLQPPTINGRTYEGGRIFYKKRMPDEKVAKLYFREGYNGKENLLFDPTTFIKDKTLTIQGALPSYDGKKIVISYSADGAEVSTLKVLDVDTKTFMPESIYPSFAGAISWTFDNKAFTYFLQKTGDNTDPEGLLNSKTKLHYLGNDVKDDIDFFSNAVYTNLGIAPNLIPIAGLNKDSKEYIFGDLNNVSPEMFTYYAPVTQLTNKKIDWKLLCKPEDKLVRGREIIGNDVYAITYKNAKIINLSILH